MPELNDRRGPDIDQLNATSKTPQNARRGFAHVVLVAMSVEALFEYLLLVFSADNTAYFPLVMVFRAGQAAIFSGLFSFGVYLVGRRIFRLEPSRLRRASISMLETLVFTGVAYFLGCQRSSKTRPLARFEK